MIAPNNIVCDDDNNNDCDYDDEVFYDHIDCIDCDNDVKVIDDHNDNGVDRDNGNVD